MDPFAGNIEVTKGGVLWIVDNVTIPAAGSLSSPTIRIERIVNQGSGDKIKSLPLGLVWDYEGAEILGLAGVPPDLIETSAISEAVLAFSTAVITHPAIIPIGGTNRELGPPATPGAGGVSNNQICIMPWKQFQIVNNDGANDILLDFVLRIRTL